MDNLAMEVVPIFKLPFSAAFLIFIMFSVIGWISEVIYVGLTSAHKFVNRGFLHGPLCPIYGVGGVVILMLPEVLYSTWIPLFISSMILCTVVEYITSYLMEKMFHARWWDYSKKKCNINGRVCLLNSVLFGFMGLFVIHFVYPYIIKFLNWMGGVVIQVSATTIGIIMLIDIVSTVYDLVDFTTTIEKLKIFGDSLKDHYGHEEWFENESLPAMMHSIKKFHEKHGAKINQSIIQKIEIIQAFKHKNVERLIQRFPSLQSEKFMLEIDGLKKIISSKQTLRESLKKINNKK